HDYCAGDDNEMIGGINYFIHSMM
ncbi:uncharacterized protein METZ01_LOCUS384322, partial [marine metagenome]